MNGKITIEAVLDDSKFNRGLARLGGSDLGATNSGLSSLKSNIGGLVGAGLVLKGVSVGINAIKNSMAGAISRYDTMNKFPVMMEAIGFSASDSERSIKRLSEGIDGLPTSLNEVVATTQQLALSTGDLERSTELTLALNNAFLSSGSSAGDASRGLVQFSQMLNKGSVDMQSWRTLQETMPLALRKTAEAFGFTGASATNDFYAALRDGEITFDQFADKLIELNDGVDGFAETAKINSKGIATSWKNIKTAVVKGTADMLKAIDNALKTWGLPSLAESFDKFKYVVRDAFKILNKGIEKFAKLTKPAVEQLKAFGKQVGKVFQGGKKLFDLFRGNATRTGTEAFLKNLGLSEDTSKKLVDFSLKAKAVFGDVADFAKKSGNIMTKHWQGIAGGWKQIFSGDFAGGLNTFKDTFMNTFNSVKDLAIEVLPKVSEAFKGLGKNIQQWVFDKLNANSWSQVGQNIMSGLGDAIQNGITFIGDIGGKVFSWIGEKLNNVDWANLGTNIGTWVGEAINFGRVSFEKIATSLRDGIFEATGSQSWGEVASKVANGIGEALDKAVVNFDKFMSGFLDGLVSAVTGINLSKVKSKLETTMEDLSKIKFTGDFGQLFRDIEGAIQKSFAGFSWQKVLKVLFEPPTFSWGSWEGKINEIKAKFQGWLDDLKAVFENWDWGEVLKKLVTPPSGSIFKDTGQGLIGNLISGLTGGDNGGKGQIKAPDVTSIFNNTNRQAQAGTQRNIQIMDNWKSQVQYKGNSMGTSLLTGVKNMWTGITNAFSWGGGQTQATTSATTQGVVSSASGVTAGTGYYNSFASGARTAVSGMQSPINATLSGILGHSQTTGTGVANTSSSYGLLRTNASSAISGMRGPITSSLNSVVNSSRTAGTGVEATSSNYQNLSAKSGLSLTAMAVMSALKFGIMGKTAKSETSSMKSGVGSQFNSMVSHIGSSMSSAVARMASASGQARGAGHQMGAGFYGGLAGMAGSIIALASSIASRAAAAMRSALRIHSPSRVTTQIGMYTGQGVVVGLESEAKNVERASQLLADKALPSINPNAMLGLTNLQGASGLVGVTNNQSSALNIGTIVVKSQDDIDYLMREFEWRNSQKMLGGLA